MKKLRYKQSCISVGLLATMFISIFAVYAPPVEAARDIIFPVIGSSSFTNDFNAPRFNGLHRATDIIAPKHRPVVAAVNGTVTYVGYPQPNWGWMVSIRDSAGYEYNYLHLNNDTPGTDNGKGGAMYAYAPDVKVGNKVKRGQLLGYVGDSGNAEDTVPHLHFEMFRPDNSVINPYISLKRAKKIPRPITPITQPDEVLPLGNVKRGLRVAMGNFDGDEASEVVVGAGAGGTPQVRVYKGKTLLHSFLAYGSGFRGGVDVATGDVDGDGTDEIITGVAGNGPPRVRVFEPDGTPVASFYAYDYGFKGGVNVAAGDVDDDGEAEIITGVAKGGSARVRAFELDGTPIGGFFAFSSSFAGGVDVAAGDINNDGVDEIITAAGPGTLPQVKAFELDRTVVAVFNAYASNFRGGVRVSAGNVRLNDARDEIVTVPNNGPPQVKIFNGEAGTLATQHFMEQWWIGYHDIGAGRDVATPVTGVNRRASIKAAID